MERHLSAAFAITAIALTSAAWSQTDAAVTTAGSGRPRESNTIDQLSPSPSHLYVLDRARIVYRFALSKDGLPATHPDGELKLDGARNPEGLAVDAAGHVFVADPDPNGWDKCPLPTTCQPMGAVGEYAAGATGNQLPISILHLTNGPDYLKLDDAGRLYVHLNGNQEIAIFALGARDSDAPISIVPPFEKPELVSDYVITDSGALFVLAGPLAVYDDPLQNPAYPNRFMRPDGVYSFDNTLAFDTTTDRLYIQFYVSNPQYWDKVNFDVRPQSGENTSMPRWIFSGDCGSRGNANVFGTVIVKKYLMVSCNDNGEVFIYRTDQFGRQRTPVETLGQGIFVSPWEIAVGP